MSQTDFTEYKNWREAIIGLFQKDARYSIVQGDDSSRLVFACSYNADTLITFQFDLHDPEDKRLMSFSITNPETPGLNKYWSNDFQYFEEGYFDDPPSHGSPGLLFSSKNLSALNDDLKLGYRGTELHFHNQSSLLAIHLIVEKGCLASIGEYDRWHFNWRPRWGLERLKWIFSSDEVASKYFLNTVQPIESKKNDLSRIFKGVGE